MNFSFKCEYEDYCRGSLMDSWSLDWEFFNNIDKLVEHIVKSRMKLVIHSGNERSRASETLFINGLDPEQGYNFEISDEEYDEINSAREEIYLKVNQLFPVALESHKANILEMKQKQEQKDLENKKQKELQLLNELKAKYENPIS